MTSSTNGRTSLRNGPIRLARYGKRLRENDIPLYSLENKRALADFDILGISLPYETLYTNFLNILDLAHLPLRSADRDESHPLIIAGGQSVYNPEPVSPFVDAFVVGEGEEAIVDVVNAHQAWKATGGSKQELLAALAKIPGIYVPSLYQVDFNEDGTIAAVTPESSDLALPIVKRINAKLPHPSPASSSPMLKWCRSASVWRSCGDAPAAAVSATPGWSTAQSVNAPWMRF